MKISINALKKYAPFLENIPSKELIETIGSRLVEIEEIIDLAPRYKGIYIVKVVKAEPIEGTHLHLCEIDAGEHNSEFNQLENSLIQVVCGAPNVHAGMLAAWIAPGAIVPETYGNENFKISVRKLQGHESNGMLAGADELGFDNEHKSIVEIDPKVANPGDNFADIFDLNDLILDVENKSLTHRPDCFGLLGFAREVCGIFGQKFTEPQWPDYHPCLDLPISVQILNPNLCPRYSCAVFDIPDNTTSKYLTKDAIFLAKAGMRSIDPMVDLTNIIMIETGQPLHAFDYDKLVAIGGAKNAKIIVRAAESGEQIQLLDGKTISCIPEDILITSNNTPIALAGAMGGKNTEIDASTRRVVLESATFSLYNLRKTQMAHGIFSEAITRFTKGQPAAMTLPVLLETIKCLGVTPRSLVDDFPGAEKSNRTHSQVDSISASGGSTAGNHGNSIDKNSAGNDKNVVNSTTSTSENVVKITTENINNLLGTDYSVETIINTLENVSFKVEIVNKTQPEQLKITVPPFRTDIHIPEDIIEEVGRLLGYDNIPLSLPTKPFSGSEISPMFHFKHELRDILSGQLQMNELLTYSFVSRDLLEKVGQDPQNSYEIVNSISPELQCFRQQISPSLLDKVRENLKSGHHDFTFYELNQVTRKDWGLSQDNTPVIKTNLGIVSLGDFYHLKAQILALTRRGLRITLEYSQMAPGSKMAEQYPYLEPLHSVVVLVNNEVIGAFGEVKAGVLRRFKIDELVSSGEINLDAIINLPRNLERQLRVSKFPFVGRDLTFKVASSAAFGRFYSAISNSLDGQGLIYDVAPVSIYQSQLDADTKNLSFRLKFSSPEKTLEQDEISAIINKIIVEVTQLGAEIV